MCFKYYSQVVIIGFTALTQQCYQGTRSTARVKYTTTNIAEIHVMNIPIRYIYNIMLDAGLVKRAPFSGSFLSACPLAMAW